MRSNFQITTLEYHVRQVSQRNKAATDIEVYSVTNSEGFTRSTDYFNKEVFSKNVSNYKMVRRGQFAYNPSRVNVGSIDYLKQAEQALVSPLYIVFETDEKINPDYLLRYLKSNWGNAQIRANTEGAVRDSLKFKGLRNVKIPLPPLDDQIRIAHLLSKVEGLIAQRKQHLQQLDDLLKSVFLEMFGDPVRNEKGWTIQPCEEAVLDISSGTSYGGEDREFVSSDEIGVLKISAVTKGTFDPAEFKVVNQAQITKTLRFVKRGDFLFSRANTVELVAACCVVPQDFPRLFLPDKLWVLTLNAELVHWQYLNYLLKNERYRDVVRSLASGGHDSMLNISMKKFMTLGIPCPQIDLQNQFAVVVEKVETIKARYQQSLTDLENLYGALSQKAFKGELDLSRVPLPPTQQNIEPDNSHPPEQQSSPSASTTTGTKPIELSLPHDTQSLSSAAGRRAVIGVWLDTYIKQLNGGALFSSDDFLAAATQRLGGLMEDESPIIDQAAYDQIKQGIFHALGSDRLTQDYDDAANRVRLRVAKG